MQIQELTQNGIEKFFRGETVILQIFNTVIETHEKHNEKVQMIRATISDGFAYFQTIYLFVDGFSNKAIQFNVIRVKLMDNIVKKLAKGNEPGKKPLLTDSNNFCVVANKINRKIGVPISFEQFMRNGKKNPQGNRKIENSKQEEEDEEDTEEALFEQGLKLRLKNNNNQKPNQNSKRQNSSNMHTNTNTNSNTNTNTNMRNNSVTNQTKLTQYPKQRTNHSTNPIQKQQNTRNEPIKRVSIKPEVKQHEAHQNIKDLFLGMQNYKLIARLLFVWPVRVFTNKKGTQSELLNLQFGDQTGTIMCTAFGDCANRFSNLAVDKTHSISGATVTQSTYKGVTELKLTFNDSTKVGLEQNKQDVIKMIPTIQKFCISLRKLNQMEKGRSVTVICMVKQCQLVQFVSKNGNNIKKKILKLFDIQNQIECQLTTFNENAVREYPMGMYALKGVQVDQFQGNKQFKASMIFLARHLKNHPMNKRANQIQQLTFASINSNQKPKKDQLSSFSMLNQKSQDLNVGENIWTQTICYLKAIRLGGNSKNVYLSCPHCKKKILQEDATQCNHCSKEFQKPKYRYILNVNLMDDHDNIWVSAYDDAGQKVLALPTQEILSADNFAQMNQQNIKQRIQQIRYKQLKVKLVSTKQQYNNQVRVKHKIIKVLPLVYEEQNKKLLQKIKSLTGVM